MKTLDKWNSAFLWGCGFEFFMNIKSAFFILLKIALFTEGKKNTFNSHAYNVYITCSLVH